jgi:hypothetical protein
MAGLNGPTYSFQMPNSGIGFSFRAEKLFHVNNTPREQLIPTIVIDVSKQKINQDLFLETAITYLQKIPTH